MFSIPSPHTNVLHNCGLFVGAANILEIIIIFRKATPASSSSNQHFKSAFVGHHSCKWSSVFVHSLAFFAMSCKLDGTDLLNIIRLVSSSLCGGPAAGIPSFVLSHVLYLQRRHVSAAQHAHAGMAETSTNMQ